MKKVLIIANIRHAAPRIPGIAKYLSQFGWHPTILTPKIGSFWKDKLSLENRNNFTIVETEKYSLASLREISLQSFNIAGKVLYMYLKVLKTILRPFFKDIIFYPDSEKKWQKHALKKADILLRKEKFSIIVSSSSPVTCHLIAKKIKLKYNIPWVADLRDLWTQNYNYSFSQLRKYIERQLELKTLKYADAIVSVSPDCVNKLIKMHNNIDIFCITNGYDPENKIEKNICNKTIFKIVYTGQIYNKKQNYNNILTVLNELIEENKINQDNIQLDFYGPSSYLLEKKIRKKLSNIVKLHNMISREESLIKQKESQLLLLFNWEDKKDKGVVPLKYYEYMNANKPIIAIGGHGNDFLEYLIKSTKTGIYCKSIIEIKKAILNYYNEYVKNGYIKHKVNIDEINKYSYIELAKKYAKLLNKKIIEEY